MRQRSVAEMSAVAVVTPVQPLTKAERLRRWAQAIEDRGGAMIALPETEFVPPSRRRALRADHSPIAVAFADHVLRARGLAGDTYGHALDHFDLTEGELHYILCGCFVGTSLPAPFVAGRLRLVAARSERRVGSWLMPAMAMACAASVLAVFLA